MLTVPSPASGSSGEVISELIRRTRYDVDIIVWLARVKYGWFQQLYISYHAVTALKFDAGHGTDQRFTRFPPPCCGVPQLLLHVSCPFAGTAIGRSC